MTGAPAGLWRDAGDRVPLRLTSVAATARRWLPAREGIKLVETAQDLATGRFLAPLVVSADGLEDAGNGGVWLGAEGLTAPGTASCNDWSSKAAADTGQAASLQYTPWLGSPFTCDYGGGHLYCLQE